MNTDFQKMLMSKVATRAQHYLRHGASRHEAFLGAWEDTERPVYRVRYMTEYPDHSGWYECKKDFRSINKAHAYERHLANSLNDDQLDTLDIEWNKEADRKLKMTIGTWDAEAEFLYNAH